jgi:single-strand DNA-binding protein
MEKVQIQGNLGADPEQRYTQEGAKVLTIRVACNRREGRDRDRNITTWYRVSAFGERDGGDTWLTERIAKLQKGDAVFVSGNLEIGEYESRDGDKRTSLDIRRVDLLYKIDWMRAESDDDASESRGNGRRESSSNSRSAVGAGVRTSSAAPADDSDLEDLPF